MIFWIKFAQKGYFQSETEKLHGGQQTQRYFNVYSPYSRRSNNLNLKILWLIYILLVWGHFQCMSYSSWGIEATTVTSLYLANLDSSFIIFHRITTLFSHIASLQKLLRRKRRLKHMTEVGSYGPKLKYMRQNGSHRLKLIKITPTKYCFETVGYLKKYSIYAIKVTFRGEKCIYCCWSICATIKQEKYPLRSIYEFKYYC